MALFGDDPDTVVDPFGEGARHTIIGLPAPARLPAEAPGAKYRRLYPVKLDPPLILENRVDGIDWSAPVRVHVMDPTIVPHITPAGLTALGGDVLCGCARCEKRRSAAR